VARLIFTPDFRMPTSTNDIDQLLSEVGPKWQTDIRHYGEIIKEAYAPLIAASPRQDISVARDNAYGQHARQVLDVFSKTGAQASHKPVIVFVHGGAFVRGDKCLPNGMYDNVLYWFARQGFIGVNLEYRLAPEAAFPGAVDDLALGLEWVAKNITAHGGDPTRIALVGHSAGGTHVASYVFDPLLGHLGKHTKAAVLMCARLRADQSPENPNTPGVKAYFGDDIAGYETKAPMAYAACSAMPVFIINAEFENPLLDVYGLEFAHKLAQARRHAPRYLSARRHNHMSILAHFNTDEETVGPEIVDFLLSALAISD
jgi:acetyl esterase